MNRSNYVYPYQGSIMQFPSTPKYHDLSLSAHNPLAPPGYPSNYHEEMPSREEPQYFTNSPYFRNYYDNKPAPPDPKILLRATIGGGENISQYSLPKGMEQRSFEHGSGIDGDKYHIYKGVNRRPSIQQKTDLSYNLNGDVAQEVTTLREQRLARIRKQQHLYTEENDEPKSAKFLKKDSFYEYYTPQGEKQKSSSICQIIQKKTKQLGRRNPKEPLKSVFSTYVKEKNKAPNYSEANSSFQLSQVSSSYNYKDHSANLNKSYSSAYKPKNEHVKPFQETQEENAKSKIEMKNTRSSDEISEKTPKVNKKQNYLGKISSEISGVPRIRLSDFIILKNLGEGRFGTVHMAIHRATGAIFALKKISKAVLTQNMLVDQFIRQLRIQSLIASPYVLKIYGWFHDTTHIYLILEFMEQGTLYSYMKKAKKLSDNDAAIKMNQIIEAVFSLHSQGIAHRDIKPENVVMSNDVCKLCDFGWATFCDDRRKTYCGTTDYVAPQIVEGIEYDMTVDLWCLGVLAFELLTGKAPFYHVSRKQTMRKIMNVQSQAVVYPEYLTSESIDAIQKLLRKDPLQRISAEKLLKHTWLVNRKE